MTKEESDKQQEYLRGIREMSASIIHQTFAYLNDDNIKRLNLIENEIENIHHFIDKIRKQKS